MVSIVGRPAVSNPLLKFTLRGKAAELDAQAIQQRPLLDSFCLAGQGTVLCAPPNAGKTLVTLALLIEAVDEGRIRGGDVFYVDADDTTSGVADKVRLLDEYGVHVVAEGFGGFRANPFMAVLEEMMATGAAAGKFLILDTFKKFTQPMSKVETSRFTEVVVSSSPGGRYFAFRTPTSTRTPRGAMCSPA